MHHKNKKQPPKEERGDQNKHKFQTYIASKDACTAADDRVGTNAIRDLTNLRKTFSTAVPKVHGRLSLYGSE
jgi:hypothetical protein